jgi:hypothetical protein
MLLNANKHFTTKSQKIANSIAISFPALYQFQLFIAIQCDLASFIIDLCVQRLSQTSDFLD